MAAGWLATRVTRHGIVVARIGSCGGYRCFLVTVLAALESSGRDEEIGGGGVPRIWAEKAAK